MRSSVINIPKAFRTHRHTATQRHTQAQIT